MSPEGSCCTASRHGTPRPFTYSDRTRWPGPLGAIMKTLTSVRRLDELEMDVEAVAEGQILARR